MIDPGILKVEHGHGQEYITALDTETTHLCAHKRTLFQMKQTTSIKPALNL